MRIHCFRFLPIVVVSGFLAATLQSAFAHPTPLDQDSTGPQIVRLSYVEGDVRISRAKLAAKQDGVSTGWEQAVANLPIQSGYSLVTGTGRAEIEFEDSSTVYLADNSVLTFAELTTTEGVPYTEIALLSGTATVNVHPIAEGEWFKVDTPSDTISLAYPRKAVWRIDSYLDAVSITPQRDPSVTDVALVAGQSRMIGKTTTYNHGNTVSRPVTADADALARWDAWVAKRLAARAEAYHATMKEAGLKSPVPGLAEMNGQGHFFSCAPYGTCWEPTHGWDGKDAEVASAGTAPAAGEVQVALGQHAPPSPTLKSAKASKPSASDVYLAAHPGATLYTEDFFFPCDTFAVQDVVAIDPATGKQKIIDSYFDLNAYMDSVMWPYGTNMNGAPYGGRYHYGLFMGMNGLGSPWGWAVCHSGSWIRWNHRYAWVAGSRRHRHCPIIWVSNGRNVGFVPVHPRDGAGKPPVNLRDGLFKATGNKAQPFSRVPFEEGKPLKILSEPPKDFRKDQFEPLKSAQAPTPMAYSAFLVARSGTGPLLQKEQPISRGILAGNSGKSPSSELRIAQSNSAQTKAAGTPILFDRKTQSFSVAQRINVDGRPVTVQQSLGRAESYSPNSNSWQARGTAGSNGYSNSANASRSYTPSQSSGSSSSRSYTPPSSSNASSVSVRASTPAPSYSPPPAPSAPTPSYSAPASSSAPSHPAGK
jgi:hypothetical protein